MEKRPAVPDIKNNATPQWLVIIKFPSEIKLIRNIPKAKDCYFFIKYTQKVYRTMKACTKIILKREIKQLTDVRV